MRKIEHQGSISKQNETAAFAVAKGEGVSLLQKCRAFKEITLQALTSSQVARLFRFDITPGNVLLPQVKLSLDGIE